MKIVKPSATLMGLMFPFCWSEKAGDFVVEMSPEKLIERAGRVCYKSEERITEDSARAFCEMVAKNHHEAVLEHSCASYLFVGDRGFTHEAVRHRIASPLDEQDRDYFDHPSPDAFCQESTRYCNYSKEKFDGEISVMEPPGLSSTEREVWESSVLIAEAAYMKLIAGGTKPQIARSVLPTCTKAELMMTANFREWKHFIRLRTSPAAHPQMVEIARMVEESLKKIAPTVFGGNDAL